MSKIVCLIGLLVCSLSQQANARAAPIATVDESARSAGQPLRVISYNVLEGFRGNASGRFPAGEERRQLVSAWLSEQKPDVIAFQELNGYTEQRLQKEAGAWKHAHAATLKDNGYIVGLTSRYPIEVVERLMPGMHHGMLHCRTAGIDCFVVHLSPFKFRHRQREAQLIAERVKRALDANRPVIVLGDFNALSPADRSNYDDNQALLQRMQESDAKHDHVENLDQGKIDYSVMKTLLDVGLVDLYDRHRDENAPTRRRIDFILASADLAQQSTSAEWFVTREHESMSDHFPVSADIQLSSKN
ncbi:MAG: endonuclease/exonuclease/phosphatase family protein [Aeoliella sp.]